MVLGPVFLYIHVPLQLHHARCCCFIATPMQLIINIYCVIVLMIRHHKKSTSPFSLAVASCKLLLLRPHKVSATIALQQFSATAVFASPCWCIIHYTQLYHAQLHVVSCSTGEHAHHTYTYSSLWGNAMSRIVDTDSLIMHNIKPAQHEFIMNQKNNAMIAERTTN